MVSQCLKAWHSNYSNGHTRPQIAFQGTSLPKLPGKSLSPEIFRECQALFRIESQLRCVQPAITSGYCHGLSRNKQRVDIIFWPCKSFKGGLPVAHENVRRRKSLRARHRRLHGFCLSTHSGIPFPLLAQESSAVSSYPERFKKIGLVPTRKSNLI